MLEYAELGMEAVWKIEVDDFPAFIVVDDKGNDFFEQVDKPHRRHPRHDQLTCLVKFRRRGDAETSWMGSGTRFRRG